MVSLCSHASWDRSGTCAARATSSSASARFATSCTRFALSLSLPLRITPRRSRPDTSRASTTSTAASSSPTRGSARLSRYSPYHRACSKAYELSLAHAKTRELSGLRFRDEKIAGEKKRKGPVRGAKTCAFQRGRSKTRTSLSKFHRMDCIDVLEL